jgi:hypothetical protein
MRKFFELISDGCLTPSDFYVLYCIYENMEARFVNRHLELKHLRQFYYLDKNNNITILGVEMIKKVEKVFGMVSHKDTGDERKGIDEYYEMWPRIKLPSGKYARSDKKNLESAFKWFFKTYPYSWDTVLKATALYLDHYETNGWMYMRTSQYFIRKIASDKTVTSELADYCSTVESGNTDLGNDNHFKDKVV